MNFKDIFRISVPYSDGTYKYVTRITKKSTGELLWKVPTANITYKDNLPITVTYNINDDSQVVTYAGTNSTEPSKPIKTLYLHRFNGGPALPPGPNMRYFGRMLHNFAIDSFAMFQSNKDLYLTFYSQFTLTCGFKVSDFARNRTLFTLIGQGYNRYYHDHLVLSIIGSKLRLIQARNWYGTRYNVINATGKLLLNRKDLFYWIKYERTSSKHNIYVSVDGKNYTLDISYNVNYNFINASAKLDIALGVEFSHNDLRQNPFDAGQIDLSKLVLETTAAKYKFELYDDMYMHMHFDNRSRFNFGLPTQMAGGPIPPHPPNYPGFGPYCIGNFGPNRYMRPPTPFNWLGNNEFLMWMHFYPYQHNNGFFNRQDLFHFGQFNLQIYNGRLWWDGCYNDKYPWTRPGESDFRYNSRYTHFYLNFLRYGNRYYIRLYDPDRRNILMELYHPMQLICLNQYMYFGCNPFDTRYPFLGHIYHNDSWFFYNNKKIFFGI